MKQQSSLNKWAGANIVGTSIRLSVLQDLVFKGKKTWLRQPFLFKSLEKRFGKQFMKAESHKMQGIPKPLIVRHINNIEKIAFIYHGAFKG